MVRGGVGGASADQPPNAQVSVEEARSAGEIWISWDFIRMAWDLSMFMCITTCTHIWIYTYNCSYIYICDNVNILLIIEMITSQLFLGKIMSYGSLKGTEYA